MNNIGLESNNVLLYEDLGIENLNNASIRTKHLAFRKEYPSMKIKLAKDANNKYGLCVFLNDEDLAKYQEHWPDLKLDIIHIE